MSDATTFGDLHTLAVHLRQELENKKFILLYAYNGTGKTRLSTAFTDLGKVVNADGETEQRDTLYFNAFTEDLFSWDNDLENDSERKLTLNTNSSFFDGLESMEMDNRIRALLNRYADFDFRIDTTNWEVVFTRELRVKKGGDAGDEVDSAGAEQGESENEYETRREEAIKISRGEENIFIWCFFLAIVELALDDDGDGPYNWVRYIYIDDPISSLDEHNAIAVANHLAQLLKRPEEPSKDRGLDAPHAIFQCALQRAGQGEQILSRPRRVVGKASPAQHRGYAIVPPCGHARRALRGRARWQAVHPSFQHAPRNPGKDRKLSRLQELLRVHKTRR